MISRRDFLHASAAAAAISGADGWLRRAPAQAMTEDSLTAFDTTGNVSLIHITDIHAQLKPIYFREPSINLGVGDAKGKPPHITGAAFLERYGVPADSAEDETSAAESADDGPVFGHAVNVENLTYTGDGDFIGIGNSADNVISSGGGEDVLFGLAGDDVLYGGGGDDALFGGEGNDLLVGGYGDDRLEGGSGDDVLFLGRNSCPGQESYGRDTIVLKPGFGSDIVIGFDPYDCSDGHDRLDVSAYESLSADSIGSDIQITACGPHTIITINEDSITLLDVNASTIGKEDFIFS
mgnify:CR=1 FL=1